MSIAETGFSTKRGAGSPGTAPLSVQRPGQDWRMHSHQGALRSAELTGHSVSGFEKSFSTHRISEKENAATLGSISVSRHGS